MRKHPNGFGDKLKQTGGAIGEAIRNAAGRLTKSSGGQGRTYAGGRTRGTQQGPTPVLGAPGTPIRSGAASNMHGRGVQQERGQKKTFSTGRVQFANKKRFAITMSAVVAAVMVPIIATSAVEGGVFRSHGVSVDVPAVYDPATEDGAEAKTIGAYASGSIVEEGSTLISRSASQNKGSEPAPDDGTTAAAAAAESSTDDNDAVDTQSLEGTETAGDDAAESPEPTEDPYRPLAPGERNDAVIELQQRLMELHYMENDEPTDYYGPQTQQAVAYFQRKNGLDVDGYAGPDTQDVLFSGEAKVYTVSDGAEGNDVWEMQERLQELGYDVGVTGYYGSETADAVRYFQRMNGLTDDGSVGTETKDILFSEHAEPAIPPEPEPEPEPETPAEEGSGETHSSSGSGESSESSSSESGSSKGESSSSHESESSESKSEESSSKKEESSGGGDAPAAASGSVEAFVDAACAQEGKPYVLGGKGPNVFDCSGLVYYALKASGNGIGYMTSGGWANSGYPSISWDNLQRGDVVCMKGHVAVYLGGGMMCDASSSNGQIMIRSMGNWARNNFICGKRPL